MVIRVWDLRIETPTIPWTCTYNNVQMQGPPPETRFERSDLSKWWPLNGIGSNVQSYGLAAPNITAHQFGVGPELLMMVNDATYDNHNWVNNSYEIMTFNPYTGDVSWTYDGLEPGDWDSNPANIKYPGWNATGEIINCIIPVRPAPRDVPWCAGQHYDHSSLWVGQYRCISVQPTNTQGLPPGEEYDDLYVQAWRTDQGEGGNPLAIPSLAFQNQTPWQQYLHLFDPPIENAEQVAPLPGHIDIEHIEIRDYDRLPANEHRGAIDAVCWHEGWRIWAEQYPRLGDGANTIDYFKTRKRAVSAPGPINTGAYIWIRKQSLDPLVNGVRANSEYEVIDIKALHDNVDQFGRNWTPLALTITPFGDIVYLLLSNNADNVEYFWDGNRWIAGGRRWRIVRPGYWWLETRCPKLIYGDWGTLPFWSFTEHNYFGDLITDDRDEFASYAAQKTSIKMTCNEHWLYLQNFPARVTDTYDLRLVDTRNGVNPVDVPSAFREEKFSNELGFWENGQNLGSKGDTEYFLASFPPIPDMLHFKTNVFWDWSIDLHSGHVRLPWRTQYTNAQLHYGVHSIYGSWWNFVPSDWTNDIDIDAEIYDFPHQNRGAFSNTDTIPKVNGVTPSPTFY
jgi:hypothetical protein